MTVRELIDANCFQVICEGTDTDIEITDVFCCDLLSIAMSRGIPGAAWVTVMGNINTLAVLRLTEMSCIILAESVPLDETGREKAALEGVTVLSTKEPVFRTALKIHEMIQA